MDSPHPQRIAPSEVPPMRRPDVCSARFRSRCVVATGRRQCDEFRRRHDRQRLPQHTARTVRRRAANPARGHVSRSTITNPTQHRHCRRRRQRIIRDAHVESLPLRPDATGLAYCPSSASRADRRASASRDSASAIRSSHAAVDERARPLRWTTLRVKAVIIVLVAVGTLYGCSSDDSADKTTAATSAATSTPTTLAPTTTSTSPATSAAPTTTTAAPTTTATPEDCRSDGVDYPDGHVLNSVHVCQDGSWVRPTTVPGRPCQLDGATYPDGSEVVLGQRCEDGTWVTVTTEPPPDADWHPDVVAWWAALDSSDRDILCGLAPQYDNGPPSTPAMTRAQFDALCAGVEPVLDEPLPVVILDGLHVVGRDVPPGRYIAYEPSDCYWETLDESGEILDNNFVSEAMQVIATIRPDDFSFTNDGCGPMFQILD
jgi:hypothetical protein